MTEESTPAPEPGDDDAISEAEADDAELIECEVGLEGEAPETDADPLTLLTIERDTYLADLQRVSAEFANFRKQAEKRSADVAVGARGRVLESLLPVFDAFEAAIAHGSTEVQPVYGAFQGALEGIGLTVLDPVGEPFDPNQHDAVMTEESDEPGDVQTVAEVLRRGYAIEGRVVRPAMVKVRT